MRAYSLFEVKSISDEKRIITGIATTPTPDRVSDVVEPGGMKQRGPTNLFLYHAHHLPVGQVTFGAPTKKGIPFTASIPDVKEEGTVRERVNEAWHSVKYKLLQAVSIGFKPLYDGYEIMRDGGIRYLDWEILELSLVGVPANPEAVITSFKSMDSVGIRNQLGLELADGRDRQELINKSLRGAVHLQRTEKSKPENLNGAVRLIRCSLLGMITDDELKAAKDKDYNTQDTKFVRDMIKHHQMAIDMSTKQVGKGKNEEIIKLAKAIIDAQKGEITDMKKWLKDRGLSESGDGSMDM